MLKHRERASSLLKQLPWQSIISFLSRGLQFSHQPLLLTSPCSATAAKMGALINAVVLSSLIMGLHTTSADTVPTNHSSEFEKAGFTFIGTMSDRQSGTVKGGIQSIGVQTISLFISPREHLATQDEAIRNCRSLYGHLLFVVNDEQFQDVRAATNRITDYFWTSAMYDVNSGVFVWSHLGLPVSSSHFASSPFCRTGSMYRGLVVQGSLSSFGFCSMDSDTPYRYICRV